MRSLELRSHLSAPNKIAVLVILEEFGRSIDDGISTPGVSSKIRKIFKSSNKI
jgi:hypothetical protein